jgi:hypothetical protein
MADVLWKLADADTEGVRVLAFGNAFRKQSRRWAQRSPTAQQIK